MTHVEKALKHYLSTLSPEKRKEVLQQLNASLTKPKPWWRVW